MAICILKVPTNMYDYHICLVRWTFDTILNGLYLDVSRISLCGWESRRTCKAKQTGTETTPI